MSKLKLFATFIVIVNIFIFIFVDSIYCSKDWFLILLGVCSQTIILFLLLNDFFPSHKESKGVLSSEKAIIFTLLLFGATYIGNLGVDITGRADDCPNTWLLYLDS